MKNIFIFHSVAQLTKFKAVKTSFNFKAQSKINPAVYTHNIMLSSKHINKAGYL